MRACGIATTPATLAEAINRRCREAAQLAAQQDYRGAIDCFDRATALMDEQAKQAASRPGLAVPASIITDPPQ
jgi:hypothetical protein